MVDKIDMSLDDIIKSSKGKRGTGRRGGRGGNRAGGQRRGGGSFRGTNRASTGGGGGVMRGRSRGGIARQNYTRVSKNNPDIYKYVFNRTIVLPIHKIFAY